MNDKYELLTDDTVTIPAGKTLYRIRALTSLRNVAKGDLGGYIAAEANLEVSGDAWVFGDAQVSGGAHDRGRLYIGTLNAGECEQFEQAAAREGVSVREALDSLVRDYAQLHAPHSVKA